jgi:2-amino-4-hydroxy-6-hydroxymethyldihydropteridine diphosphokinase
MAKVLLSLGSNIEREQHIGLALQELQQQFGDIACSPIYESEAVGFVGDPFYNLVVQIQTDKSVGELSALLHRLEDQHGRIRGGEKFSARTLDIDILTYDDVCGVVDGVSLPRGEILKNAFVLLPLADLVPHDLHPVQHRSYLELWQAFDQQKQKLWQVAL